MARTLGTRNKHKNARQQYKEKADTTAKRIIIVYNYLINITREKEGWDIKKAGSVDHWSTSEFIQDNIPKGAFYRLGKVSYFAFFCWVNVNEHIKSNQHSRCILFSAWLILLLCFQQKDSI